MILKAKARDPIPLINITAYLNPSELQVPIASGSRVPYKLYLNTKNNLKMTTTLYAHVTQIHKNKTQKTNNK